MGDQSDPEAARNAFANAFGEVSQAMNDRAPGAEPLVRAWQEFHKTIVDETKNPILNTARPSAFFVRVIPQPRELIFWSNTFVGIGLILTFIGIVVALHTASEGMVADSTVKQQQAALQGLLNVAAAKFFSSIAGLAASLMLRFAENNMTRRLNTEVNRLCDLLEKGLMYVPAQLLAVQQLDELKRQSTQLEKFNTDLALSIGEQVGQQFQAVMSPMQASLGALHTSIDSMSESLSKSLGDGVGKAIEGAASGQLGELAKTLANLGEQLAGLSEHVQGSGEDAARQIRAAGADFAQAAQDIREAFSGLTSQVGEIGAAITQDADAARKQQADLLQLTMAGFEAANQQTQAAMAGAVQSLQDAGTKVAGDLQAQMGDAMTSAAKEAQALVRAAIEDSSKSFADAGKSISDAVESAALRIAALATAIEKSERHASSTAEAFMNTADGARSAASSMADAAGGFATAATPVANAAKALQEAATRIAAKLDESEKSAVEALKSMQELVDGIEETQASATEAWTSYRSRFDGVDKSLEGVLNEMKEQLSNSMKTFETFSQAFDAEMGKAVSRLGGVLEPLKENSEAIAELADELKKQNRVEAGR
ncbi:anti-phage ZorAB system protein ZorA [Asticcacaulis biprosthecium]|uniref:anti-phage ZorAB system protein ZorA n=1 Tax=Asticcacaulis biprosthecium TaxID=76891 RepID=UPI0012F4DA61|nr:anti-phage ZorAB system protein ZorA [Asticcacaulis biprosthecium]